VLKFKQYISEKIYNSHNMDYSVLMGEIVDASKKLGTTSIIYRGFSTSGAGGMMKVTNEREGFYGSLDDNAKQLLKQLGVKNPYFATRSKLKAGMFGSVYILVPSGKFSAYQSKSHSDLLSGFRDTDDDINTIAKTYQKTLKSVNDMEIIFDGKEYYLIDIGWVLNNIDRGNKFQKFTKDKINTYKDLYNALKSIKSFYDWKEKQREKK